MAGKERSTRRAAAIDVADSIPKLTLRQLGYFLAAANHQSVGKAAQALNVSAPSVSMAITHIESTIEARLFVRRHARGLLLTQIGRDLAISARNVLQHAREIEMAGHGSAAAVSGRLSVGCLVSLAPFLLPPLLKKLPAAYPRIQLRWREGDHESLLDGLESGALDLALLYDFDMPSTIHCTQLRAMPPQLVLNGKHRLASRSTLSLRDFVDEPLILLDLPKSRDYFLSIFSDLGLEPRIAHRTSSYEMVRGLVANGHGYSLLNFCPSYRFPGQGTIVSRPLAEATRGPHLVLARLHRYRTPPIFSELLGLARNFSADLPVTAQTAEGSRARQRDAARTKRGRR